MVPLYNEDLEANVTAGMRALPDRVRKADAVLFVTPECNRSVPGLLKNRIDVGSRPYGKSVFSKKPVAVVSVTPGALGAFGANHHPRQSFVFLDMPVLQQPEAYIPNPGNCSTRAAPSRATRRAPFSRSTCRPSPHGSKRPPEVTSRGIGGA